MNPRTNFLIGFLLFGLIDCLGLYAQNNEPLSKVEKENILKSFVHDFSRDPFAREMRFGFKVDQDQWHMVIEKDSTDGLSALLKNGFPNTPILYWEMDSETLSWLDKGLNGETATARAQANDPYPLRTRATDGFPRYTINKGLNDFLEELRLHFWTRGFPESFVLSKDVARISHGGYVVGLVYAEGLRTMWFQLDPGQHVNKDPIDQKNPSHSLVIVTRGKYKAKIGGEELIFEEGHSYLIPAEVSHEFWNSFDSPAQGVLIMYGEGA
jgi:quercetin dioxygenase-like cupin family protein